MEDNAFDRVEVTLPGRALERFHGGFIPGVPAGADPVCGKVDILGVVLVVNAGRCEPQRGAAFRSERPAAASGAARPVFVGPGIARTVSKDRTDLWSLAAGAGSSRGFACAQGDQLDMSSSSPILFARARCTKRLPTARSCSAIPTELNKVISSALERPGAFPEMTSPSS